MPTRMTNSSTLGTAAGLCPHSPPNEVQKIQSDLREVLAGFTHTVDPDRLFLAIAPLAQDYAQTITGDAYTLLNRNEHNTLVVSFLRQVSLAAQTMIATMLLTREPE